MKTATGSIRKKTQTRNGKDYTYWEARYTVGTDPVTGKQIQKTVTAKTRTEVRQKLTAAMASLDDGSYIEPSHLTLGQWLNIWVQTYLVEQKAGTVKAYKSAIQNHIIPALGPVRLDRLNTNQVQAFYSGLYDTLSTKSVRCIHGVLHEALDQAVKSGMISRSPCDGCKTAKPVSPDIRPMEPAELSCFLQAAQQDDYYNLFILAAFSGMRQGEILGLSWRQVDFSNGVIDVSQQLQRIDGSWQIVTPKSGHGRTIAPAQIVMDALASEHARQVQNRQRYAEIWQNPMDLVFTNDIGSNLVSRTVVKHFKNILSAADLPDFRFHDLRHTFAVSSLLAGDDIKTLQGNLGHSTAAFTLDTYAHYTDQMRHDSGRRMQAFYDSITDKGKIRVKEKPDNNLKVI